MTKKPLTKCTESGTFQSILWHPAARRVIVGFPEGVRKEVGYLLFRLQLGESLSMPVVRSMKSVAVGVSEIRVRGPDGSYRVFYLVKSAHGVLVFHAFKKKTEQTPVAEIQLGRRRLKELLDSLDGKT